MATDKSLRQHYQGGEKVSPFKKGFETIAGKAVDLTSKFAPKTKEEKTGTFDLQSMVKSQAKSAIKNRIQSAVLSKLGLSFLNPFMGIASLFGFDPFSMAKKTGIMQGFAPGMKEPGQTQAQYEAARAARQTQSRIDSMLGRKAAGKSYSQKVLNELTMGSRPGFYGNVPTVSRVNIAKNLIGMPENIGDRGSITQTPTGLVNPIQQARDEVAAKEAVTTAKASPGQMAADRAAKNAAIQEAVSQQIGASRGNGGGGGGAVSTGAGRNPWGRADGGRIGKPLPGRNRYL